LPPPSQSPRQFQAAQAEFSSRQTESDNPDNIGVPDRNDKAPARDGDTGQNQSAADLEAQSRPPFSAGGPAPSTGRASDTGAAGEFQDATVIIPAVPAHDDPAPEDLAPEDLAPEEPAPEDLAPEPPAPEEPAPEEPAPAIPEPVSPASAGPEDLDATAVIEAISDTGPRPGTASRDPEATPAIDYPGEDVPAGKVPEPELAAQPHVRVDARLLEAALLNLRKRVASIPLVFEIAGAAEVKTERNKLLSQIDDYLLPRVRRSAAPILVALVGSTGAGKSTLVNSIVGTHVSATGVRRPTTNSPVLACHPDEIDWFAENNFLPTLPRVRQEGLARPGRDGLLVLAASEGMPRGIALLDTPDIDSVVQAHHEFAYQFLDASDLWLFMTSSSRYADGPVWEILQHARERKASLGVVLSRVPQQYRTELVSHFHAMLDANGIASADRFVIQETPLVDGMLPPDAYKPVRDWLASTADGADRRVAVLSQTMSGVLDTFKSRVPALAAHVEAQVVLRGELRRAADTAYESALVEAGAGMRDGSLLRGEVLARWEDCVVAGELRPRRGVKAARPVGKKGKRARRGPSRTAALNAALRSAVESYITSVADRAAETVEGSWRADPAGAKLLDDAAAERARDVRAKQVFESVFGPAGQSGHADPADVDIKAADMIDTKDAATSSAFSRSSPGLALRAARAVGAWQDHLARLVEVGDLRPAARRAAFDDEALSLVVLVAMLGETGTGDSSVYTEPRQMLDSVFGGVTLTELLAKARADLYDRVRLLLDEELVRFVEVIDAAGPCDDVAAIRLYQAEFSLEAVR
jgi:energy-coupling factor transporter ATP-binding protein EcfA2